MINFDGYRPTWCPGCGNWGVGVGIKIALKQLDYTPDQIFMVFGIGCSGNMNDFLNTYAIHALHGRAIPNAIGMKIANHQRPVIVVAGDGDCYGEGGNHFLHACRGNHDITVIVHDNRVYGLTTGQVSLTARQGTKSKSTPLGILEQPVDPLLLALTQGATFVSQVYAGDMPNLVKTITQAIKHRGFALVNVLQPCVTFDSINTFQYYQSRLINVPAGHKHNKLAQAIELVHISNQKEKYLKGIIYQVQQPTYTEQLPQIKQSTLLKKTCFKKPEILLKQFI